MNCGFERTTSPGIVIASGNSHKNREIQSIIKGIGVRWLEGFEVSIENVDESGSTYEENAILKATAYSNATGLPALADDSGLEVDAMGGLPGIRSNRFFGDNLTDSEKIRKLLERIKDVPDSQRTARFVCHAVLLQGETLLKSARGVVEGTLLREPLGDSGFGYDPIFWIPALEKSFAQLNEAEKNQLSHRGRAMRHIREFLLRCTNQTW